MQTLTEYEEENQNDEYLKVSLIQITEEDYQFLNNEKVLQIMRMVATFAQIHAIQKEGISGFKFVKGEDGPLLVIEVTPSSLLNHEVYQETSV